MGVRKFLLPTTQWDCSSKWYWMVRVRLQENREGLCKAQWPLETTTDCCLVKPPRLVRQTCFLHQCKTLSLESHLIQFQRRHLCLMEVGGAGNIDLEAVDTWKEGVNLDVSIDQWG